MLSSTRCLLPDCCVLSVLQQQVLQDDAPAAPAPKREIILPGAHGQSAYSTPPETCYDQHAAQQLWAAEDQAAVPTGHQ